MGKAKSKSVDVNDKELKENLKNIEKEIVRKKEMPKEELLKVNKKIFENIIIAIVIMLFLGFISLGSLNIESTVFITDLKVFSMSLIVFTVLLFEYSYKKGSGNICVHGIETLFLAVFTLISIKTYTMYFEKFHFILATSCIIVTVYYAIKTIRASITMKKEYLASINDINEIIKK